MAVYDQLSLCASPESLTFRLLTLYPQSRASDSIVCSLNVLMALLLCGYFTDKLVQVSNTVSIPEADIGDIVSKFTPAEHLPNFCKTMFPGMGVY